MGGVRPPKTIYFLRESFGMLLGSPPPLDVALISTGVARKDNLCGRMRAGMWFASRAHHEAVKAAEAVRTDKSFKGVSVRHAGGDANKASWSGF